MEINALRSSIVVTGMNNLNPGLSITISTGRWPKGILASQGQQSPAAIIKIPAIIKNFCILNFIRFFSASQFPLTGFDHKTAFELGFILGKFVITLKFE